MYIIMLIAAGLLIVHVAKCFCVDDAVLVTNSKLQSGVSRFYMDGWMYVCVPIHISFFTFIPFNAPFVHFLYLFSRSF